MDRNNFIVKTKVLQEFLYYILNRICNDVANYFISTALALRLFTISEHTFLANTLLLKQII